MKNKEMFFFILFILVVINLNSVYSKSGSIKLLAVSEESEKGSIANVNLEIKEGSGRVFIDSYPLSKIDTQISTRFAKEVACNFLELDCSNYDFFYTIKANSAIVGGPSAGAAISVLTVAVLSDLPIDDKTTMTGTINSGGIIGPVGGVLPKISAASEVGIKKVLIPKYSGLNESNISDLEKKYKIKIVQVSFLEEALKEITGKDFEKNVEINISTSYLETMSKVAKDMCNRANSLYEENEITYKIKKGDEEFKNASLIYLQRGINATKDNEFYSAASYCFGSALNSQYLKLKNELKSEKSEEIDKIKLIKKINDTKQRINDYNLFIKNRELKTITDLEIYMIVNDRLIEADERLKNALETNNTNQSVYNLAYAIERLNSAISWTNFFDMKGKKFSINKATLDESCLRKVSEVEERLQYLKLFLPAELEDIEKSVKDSYENYNNQKSELCLYKASIAKARVNLILNTMAINNEDIKNLIDDRSFLVKKIISKQNKRDIFPVLAYSYYEYGNSLKNNDEYSALLYLEYALELGNLDIYFEKSKLPINLPKIEKNYIYIFVAGLIFGILFGMAFMYDIYHLKRKLKK
ncbi:MAG: S16 family serine protease [Candidatus Woesearchaeota archaeon]